MIYVKQLDCKVIKYILIKIKPGYYSIGELVSALKIIQKTEVGIKTGKIDEENSIDYVLCSIL